MASSNNVYIRRGVVTACANIVCIGCGRSLRSCGDSSPEDFAEAVGWVVDSDGAICPDCLRREITESARVRMLLLNQEV